MISSAFNKHSEYLYNHFQAFLISFQHATPTNADSTIDLGDTRVLICGMGRVGCGAYKQLQDSTPVLALDFDKEWLKSKRAEGYKIDFADVSSTDFWSQLTIKDSKVEWILLATPRMETNMTTAKLARHWGYTGFISASAKYADEKEQLIQSGVDAVFNIYDEAGAGLALHGKSHIKKLRSQSA